MRALTKCVRLVLGEYPAKRVKIKTIYAMMQPSLCVAPSGISVSSSCSGTRSGTSDVMVKKEVKKSIAEYVYVV